MNIAVGEVVKGVFVCELKNRFLCKVKVEEEELEAYISSSSKLSHFLNLKNKEVLLTPNQNKNSRTKFTVFAVKHRNRYIMLNLNIVNKFIEYKTYQEQISSESTPYSYVARESNIDGYKADLYFENSEKVIVENKSLISTKKDAIFPSIHSSRSIEQLIKLEQLLDKGYKVIYNVISLSPYIKTVKLNKSQVEFSELFLRCIQKKMVINAYSLIYSNGEILYENVKFIG